MKDKINLLNAMTLIILGKVQTFSFIVIYIYIYIYIYI